MCLVTWFNLVCKAAMAAGGASFWAATMQSPGAAFPCSRRGPRRPSAALNNRNGRVGNDTAISLSAEFYFKPGLSLEYFRNGNAPILKNRAIFPIT
jgi:hypothetical protein